MDKNQSNKQRAALAALVQSVRAGHKAAENVAKFGKAAIAAGVTRDQFVAALQKMWGMSKHRVGSKNYRAIVSRVSYWTLQAGYDKRRKDDKAPAKPVSVPRGAVEAVLEMLVNNFNVDEDAVAAVVRAIAAKANGFVVE
jgi:hypothetical protein